MKIWKGTFDPRNLPLLRLNLQILDTPEDRLGVSGDQWTVRRTHVDEKYFGNDPAIWSQTFLNYARVLSHYHVTKFPRLIVSMMDFHAQIMSYCDTYVWQGGVLRLALRWHQEAIVRGVTLDSNWQVPLNWERQMLQAPMVKGSLSNRAASARGGSDNIAGVVCMNYNTRDKGCTWDTCVRDHICSRRGCDKKHPAFEHK